MLLSFLLQVSIPVKSLQEILDGLYDFILPLISQVILIGRVLGGLGALVYISSQVWRSLATAQPIDFYPLLRPFAIGLAIMFFPVVLSLLNGVMGGISKGFASIEQTQNQSIILLQDRKKALLAADPKNAAYEDDVVFEKELAAKDVLDFGGKAGLYFDRMQYTVQKNFREWMRNALELFYQAAGLIVSTLCTFFLIVLSLLGPITFGFSIWPGFESSLQNWLLKYINISLWVPVAHIWGTICARIQVHMLEQDITRLQTGGDLTTADYGYMIFLLIAICGYRTIPSVAGWIVSAGGMTNITRYATSMGNSAASSAAAGAGALGGRVAGGAAAVAKEGAHQLGGAFSHASAVARTLNPTSKE